MKFLLDENITPDAAAAVRAIYFGHEWVSAHDNRGRYCGVDDLDLFPILASDGFHAIVTQDKAQLRIPEERRGLIDARLHWIGLRSKGWPGLKGLAMRSSTLLAGLHFVLDDWRPEPHGYYLTGVQAEAGQRVKIQTLNVGGSL